MMRASPLGGSSSFELRFLSANRIDLDIKRVDPKRHMSRMDVLKRDAAEAEGFVKRTDLAHLLERRALRARIPRSKLVVR